jgi:hypothetical protein
MRIPKPVLAGFALLTFLSLVPATPAKAQAYLHALSDLRSARVYLQMETRPDLADAVQHSVNEINKAIDEIKIVATREGKDTWQTPPPQSGGDPAAPIHNAVRLLREARGDLGPAADSPDNNGLRDRSIKHIDEALHRLERFM